MGSGLSRFNSVARHFRVLLATSTMVCMTSVLNAQDFTHDITVSEVMSAIIMPASNVLWEAAYPESTPEGEVIKGPADEAAWLKVREAAISLAASTNLLLIPDLPVKDPALITETPAGELNPAAMAALIKSQSVAWAAHASVLHATAMQALDAIDQRDLDKLYDITGGLDGPCTGCHQQFWYPQ